MTRIYSELNERLDMYKMAMSIICTIRGIPQIYYGTEIAMASSGDHVNSVKTFLAGGLMMKKMHLQVMDLTKQSLRHKVISKGY